MQNVFAGDHWSISYINHTQNISGQSSGGTIIDVYANIGDSVSLITLCNGAIWASSEWWFRSCDFCPLDSVPGGTSANPLDLVITQHGSYITLTGTGNSFYIIPPAPPGIPEITTGKKNGLCNHSDVLYYTPPGYTHTIPAMTYTWTVPPAATIISGQGTNGIRVNYPNTPFSGQVSVTANNIFGSSPPRVINVNSNPAAPAAISGPATVCSGSTGNAYSIPSVSSAVSYKWVGPPGCHISDGTTTSTSNWLTTTSTSVTVSYGTVTPTSVLKVKVNNNCGFSDFRKLTLIPCGPREESASADAEPGHAIDFLDVFPSPVQTSVTVNFKLTKPGDVEISLLDINGRLLKTDIYINVSGEFIKNENTEALSKGIYFVRIKAGDEVVQKKFVKI